MVNGERGVEGEGSARVVLYRSGFDGSAFRRRFREALGSLGESEAGAFRQIRVREAAPRSGSGLCLVLPGGIRVEGLDVDTAVDLARRLS